MMPIHPNKLRRIYKVLDAIQTIERFVHESYNKQDTPEDEQYFWRVLLDSLSELKFKAGNSEAKYGGFDD
jgi:hypothetical protein